MTNLPTLKQIAEDPGILRGLSLEELDALMFSAETENKMISAAKRAITGHIEAEYASHIAAAYQQQGKDFGTVRIADGAYVVVVDTPKRVEWDQDKLQGAGDQIAAAGDDVREYVDVKLSVSETKYGAWPAHIREVFEPARTVKPGPRTIKLVRKEAA